jgi:methionine synthase II (cobalamin-independent)
MFVTFAGGYSRAPLPAQPDLLGQAEAALRAGTIDQAGYEAVADEFVHEVLDEMTTVSLAIVGDGGVRARDRILPWIRGLDGLDDAGETTLPDGEPATRPLVRGPIRWTRPIFVRDWTFADAATETYVKQTVVGPYTIASLAEPDDADARRHVSMALAEAMNEEFRALAAAGCAIIEIDEPAILRVGAADAEWTALRDAHERLTAGVDDPTEVHLSCGLWGGEIDPAGHASLLDLPYSSYLVDVLAGPSAWRFIAAVPPERGVIAGAADAHTEAPDEHEVLVWAMAWAAQNGRGQERVGLAPNGSLGLVSRHFAHRKCSRMGEALNLAKMGPLESVAPAIDENPATSRVRELRVMAEAVAAGRAAGGQEVKTGLA